MTGLMQQLADEITAPVALPCPEPGVYPGTPIDDYHRWSCASNSRLTKLMRSPAHLRAYLDGEQDETAALIMGRAAHFCILEPNLFDTLYARSSGADRRTKAGKQEWDDLIAQFGEGYVLKPDDHDAARKMREAVYAHAAARKLLHTGNGHVEFSVVWDARYDNANERAVQRCKARLDKLSAGIAGGVVVDVKTTRDASPREFERSIFAHGYHRQGALYLDAARAAGYEAEHFAIIAVEKEPPYAVAVYRLTEGAIEAGQEQVRDLLRTYATCEALNEWPAFGEDVQDIAIPAYGWSQLDVRSPFNSTED